MMPTTPLGSTDQVDTPGGLALHRWRRLDWHFLIPASGFSRVACGGAVDDELRDALLLLAQEVHVPRSTAEWRALSGTCDTVVLVRPTIAELGLAVDALHPGGWIYAEVRRAVPGHRPRTVPGWRTAFGRAGLSDVAAYWHVPGMGGPSMLVSLAAGTAVRAAIKGQGDGRSADVRARIATGLLAMRLFPRLVAEGSVVGRRPSSTT